MDEEDYSVYNDAISEIAGLIILAAGKYEISFKGINNDVMSKVDENAREISKIYVNSSTF